MMGADVSVPVVDGDPVNGAGVVGSAKVTLGRKEMIEARGDLDRLARSAARKPSAMPVVLPLEKAR